jgi:hypothetical protein
MANGAMRQMVDPAVYAGMAQAPQPLDPEVTLPSSHATPPHERLLETVSGYEYLSRSFTLYAARWLLQHPHPPPHPPTDVGVAVDVGVGTVCEGCARFRVGHSFISFGHVDARGDCVCCGTWLALGSHELLTLCASTEVADVLHATGERAIDSFVAAHGQREQRESGGAHAVSPGEQHTTWVQKMMKVNDATTGDVQVAAIQLSQARPMKKKRRPSAFRRFSTRVGWATSSLSTDGSGGGPAPNGSEPVAPPALSCGLPAALQCRLDSDMERWIDSCMVHSLAVILTADGLSWPPRGIPAMKNQEQWGWEDDSRLELMVVKKRFRGQKKTGKRKRAWVPERHLTDGSLDPNVVAIPAERAAGKSADILKRAISKAGPKTKHLRVGTRIELLLLLDIPAEQPDQQSDQQRDDSDDSDDSEDGTENDRGGTAQGEGENAEALVESHTVVAELQLAGEDSTYLYSIRTQPLPVVPPSESQSWLAQNLRGLVPLKDNRLLTVGSDGRLLQFVPGPNTLHKLNTADEDAEAEAANIPRRIKVKLEVEGVLLRRPAWVCAKDGAVLVGTQPHFQVQFAVRECDPDLTVHHRSWLEPYNKVFVGAVLSRGMKPCEVTQCLWSTVHSRWFMVVR